MSSAARNYGYILFLVAFVGLLSSQHVIAGTLSCTVTTSCPSGTVIYRMSGTDNAHAEVVSQANYNQLVCCTGVTGLNNSCSGTHASALKLSSITNGHSEQAAQGNYGTNACISVTPGGSVSVGYQAGNCSTYDTTLGSMSGATNAHVGDVNAYSTKICASATAGAAQSLTFSISDNTIGFGSLSSVGTRYASGDMAGADTDVADAHTISVSTNASSGYTMTVGGSTLSAGVPTVTPIGTPAAAPSVGSEQFGLRMISNSGTGSVIAPYNTANWAFDTASFPDVIATGGGDESTTVYGVRYLGNISANTETGTYGATLTYTVTATY